VKAWAIVPARAFDRSKTRLAGVLSQAARARLARRLLEGVIAALAGARGISEVAVVTDSDEVARCAAGLGALALADPPGAALAGVVDAGLAAAAAAGASAALVCMADLACAAPDPIDRVLAALALAEVVAVPDLAGRGTSALALRPPRAMATCFGLGDSLSRHRDAAARGGLSFLALRSDELAFDVDTPGDLSRLAAIAAQADPLRGAPRATKRKRPSRVSAA